MQENRRIISLLSILTAIVLGLSASCGGGGGGGGDNSPVARAGSDQNVMVASTVTLDASGSTGLVSSITWTFTSKPAGSSAVLSNPKAIKPTFIADFSGSYVLSLRIGNGTVTSSPDTVTITALRPRAVPPADLSSIMTYSDNGDGTITDHVTELMWQKCTAWLNSALCSQGSLTTYNWYQATGTYDVNSNPTGTNVCGILSLGTYTDWRLPTDFELVTIADYGVSSGPTISTAYFPTTPTVTFWSSTTYRLNSTWAWKMSFSDGTANGITAKSDGSHFVRCVRGEQSAMVLTDNNDGTITDQVTSLMWQKQDDGLTYSWSQAITECQSLSTQQYAGYSDWRVPNIKELRSIADTTKYGPAINTTYFPGTKSENYWSSTEVASNTSRAWTVNFNSGSVNNTVNKLETTSRHVRCVRSML